MLEVSHCCPSCGQVHDGRKFGIKHRAPRECPLVIIGSFPLVSLPSPPSEAPLKVPTASKGRTGNSRLEAQSIVAESLRQVEFSRPQDGERTRGLGVPWLPPPDLGEVL
jgi:hypothetical protein